jgi:hypothetical protein
LLERAERLAGLSPDAKLARSEAVPFRAATLGAAARAWRSASRLQRSTVVSAVIAVALIAASSPAVIDGLKSSDRAVAQPQRVHGPSWSHAPDVLPPQFFGVTMNSTSGAMPTFEVEALRLWDSRTRWANLEPRRGAFDWTILERMVTSAEKAGKPVLLTFGGTPQWASPDGPRTAYTDGSRTSPPDNLADWDNFVRQVVTRYRGRIGAYELWDYANSSRFYSGSTQTLVEMVRRAARIIKTVDGGARVACPSMGDLWQAAGREALRRFAAAGGYNHCDAAAVKLHARDPSGRPEEMAELATLIDKALHQAGLSLPLWATGPGFNIPDARPLDEETAANHAARFYLTGLFARFERMYFYNWGSRKIPLVLQAEGGPPTRAALGVAELQRWLASARITSCGRGRDDGLPENAWQCRFVLGRKGAERPAVIRWTDSGTATMSAEPGAKAVHHLDGRVTPVRAGQPVSLSERPVLLEYSAPPTSAPATQRPR